MNSLGRSVSVPKKLIECSCWTLACSFAGVWYVSIGFGRVENRCRFAGRGKSELHRARCCVTQVCLIGIHAGGQLEDWPTESATEN